MKGLVWAVCLFGVARSGPSRGDFRWTAAEARSPHARADACAPTTLRPKRPNGTMRRSASI